jgi:hypothetical protein
MMGRGCSVERQKLEGIVSKRRSSPYRADADNLPGDVKGRNVDRALLD